MSEKAKEAQPSARRDDAEEDSKQQRPQQPKSSTSSSSQRDRPPIEVIVLDSPEDGMSQLEPQEQQDQSSSNPKQPEHAPAAIPLEDYVPTTRFPYKSPRLYDSWPLGDLITLRETGKVGLNIIRREGRDNSDGFCFAVVGKVNPSTQAERAGVLAGDVICDPSSTESNKKYISFDDFLETCRLGIRPVAFRVVREPGMTKKKAASKQAKAAAAVQSKQATAAAVQSKQGSVGQSKQGSGSAEQSKQGSAQSKQATAAGQSRQGSAAEQSKQGSAEQSKQATAAEHSKQGPVEQSKQAKAAEQLKQDSVPAPALAQVPAPALTPAPAPAPASAPTQVPAPSAAVFDVEEADVPERAGVEPDDTQANKETAKTAGTEIVADTNQGHPNTSTKRAAADNPLFPEAKRAKVDSSVASFPVPAPEIPEDYVARFTVHGRDGLFDVTALKPLKNKYSRNQNRFKKQRYLEVLELASNEVVVCFRGIWDACNALDLTRKDIQLACQNYGTANQVNFGTFTVRYAANDSELLAYDFGAHVGDYTALKETYDQRIARYRETHKKDAAAARKRSPPQEPAQKPSSSPQKKKKKITKKAARRPNVGERDSPIDLVSVGEGDQLTTCIVCQKNKAEVVLEPCHHCVLCSSCTSQHCQSFCPVCRCKIESRLTSDWIRMKRPRIYSAYSFM